MKSKSEGIKSNYAEDWLPVKQIVNGMIQLDSGEYVTGVKIAPKNIFILDSGQQDAIVTSLRNFYNTLDYEFWLMIIDRPVDINLYLSQLQVLYQKSADPVVRKLIMQDINKANMFTSSEYGIVDIEYYIIFKEKKLEVLQKKLYNLISGLANCGLNSSQTSNADLRVILDSFFNGGVQYKLGAVM